MNETITLAHGSGGRQTNELIGSLFKKYFDNDLLTADDAAVLPRPEGRLSMSTDGFIVSPAEFPGGNIGKLSICGTVNDIACMGAKPLYLTCGFVIEEGFETARLERIVESMAKTCKEVGVKIVAGDTKVAGKGQVDGVFITTTGIGVIPDDMNVGGACAKPGDCIIGATNSRSKRTSLPTALRCPPRWTRSWASPMTCTWCGMPPAAGSARSFMRSPTRPVWASN